MIRILLLAILLLLLAWGFWKIVDGVIEAAGGKPPKSRRPGSPAVKLARDPVCGTFVAPGTALSLTSGGSTHFFCSEQCRREFSRK